MKRDSVDDPALKTLLVTIPIRPEPTSYPPLACLALMSYLRKRGVQDVDFYDIDCFRPSHEEALAHIVAVKPDILGISAVVSTAYAYTRKISLDVKRLLPDTLIVVGGNLAASAEVLLRKTGADLCVLGEGEQVLYNIVKRAEKTRAPRDFADIPGLMLLDQDGGLINTGYEAALPANEIYDFDYGDLEKFSDISRFIIPAIVDDRVTQEWMSWSSKAREPHRRGKNYTTLQVGKGCVAKCTFCHRWDKGIRHIPVDTVLARLDVLIEKYDIGFLDLSVETFAADKKWLKEFCAKIKPYDILWRAGGIRANAVNPEWIAMMADAGCASLVYGHESGSAHMLEVMEKKLALEDNYNSVAWTVDAGLWTVVQLVLGMPGECERTIRETLDFVAFSFSRSPRMNPLHVSANYAQALPGTPLYEHTRRAGKIGAGVEDEEEYLLSISDENAAALNSAINYTTSPTLEWMTWQRRMLDCSTRTYLRHFGPENLLRIRQGKEPITALPEAPYPLTRDVRQRFGIARFPALYPAITLYEQFRKGRFRRVAVLAWEYLTCKLRNLANGYAIRLTEKSLRKIVRDDMAGLDSDAPEMAPLRQGR